MKTSDIYKYCRAKYPNSSHGFLNEVEYKRDILRFMISKRMCNRYLKTGTINHKAIINNLIALVNLFGTETVLYIISQVFTRDEKCVIHAFTNWLNLSNESVIMQQISDLLADFAGRK